MKNIFKSISLPSLFIGLGAGFVLGALILGLLVSYLISNALSNTATSELLLGDAVEQVRAGMAVANLEKASTSVYGKVTAIQSGRVTLEVHRTEGVQEYTFVFDDKTTIVKLSQDAESTQVPLSSDEIEVGAGLTISTEEPVGSVENQYAVKIVQI